ITGSAWNGLIAVDGFEPQSDRDVLVFFNAITEGYLTTMGTPLLAGRDFTAADDSGSPQVGIVNEAFARKFFGARNPVGQSIDLVTPGAGTVSVMEVVGVVRDSKYRSL